jgi:dihydropteroate synthase
MSIDPKGESIEGVFYKINKKIEKKITAKYHKIKDWVMDPKGYFLIAIDKKNNLIRVGYCKFTKLGNDPVNDMVAEIVGKTAIEIVNTLIRENYISSLQHSGDMGIELCKAELALKYNLDYVQDKDLKLKNL